MVGMNLVGLDNEMFWKALLLTCTKPTIYIKPAQVIVRYCHTCELILDLLRCKFRYLIVSNDQNGHDRDSLEKNLGLGLGTTCKEGRTTCEAIDIRWRCHQLIT